jgi:hypothetical protein
MISNIDLLVFIGYVLFLIIISFCVCFQNKNEKFENEDRKKTSNYRIWFTGGNSINCGGGYGFVSGGNFGGDTGECGHDGGGVRYDGRVVGYDGGSGGCDGG